LSALEEEPSVKLAMQNVVTLKGQYQDYIQKTKLGVPPDWLRNQLKAAEAAVVKEKELRRPIVEQKVAMRLRGEAQQGIGSMTARRDALDAQLEKMDSVIGEANKAIASIGENSIDMELKRSEIEQLEKVIGVAREQQQRIYVEMQSTARRIEVIDEAHTPQYRNWRPSLLTAGLVGGWGLLLGMVGVSYREYRTRRISSKQDVSQHLNLLVFGSLPVLTNQGRRGMLPFVGRRKYDWNTVLRQSVDSIATTLMRNERTQARRMLMVTSPRSGEGKTTL